MSKKPVPTVAIDEALELFLAAACPQGLPEGEERDRLLAALRETVAADRPDWAEASPAPEPSGDPAVSRQEQTPPPAYSQVKAEIAEQTRKEPIPTDPEERFFYLRDKEARADRERRKQEERDEQAREELRRKAVARNQPMDDATLERALAIRQVLEERMERLRPPAPDRSRHSLKPTAASGPALETARRLSLDRSSFSDSLGLDFEEGLDGMSLS